MFYVFLLLICSLFSDVGASESSCEEYLALAKRYPNLVTPRGSFSNGEIELILDKEKMLSIEQATGRTVGLLARDNYWMWVNDACKFPNGSEGVYGRILWVKGLDSEAAIADVAVMSILPNGKVVLNCNYRHSTRSWEIELPSGLLNAGESIEEAAKREALEETGMIIEDVVLLGEIAPDTGILRVVKPIFIAKVVHQQASTPEDSEAIEEILTLTVPEIKAAFVRGFLEVEIKGALCKASFRDPCLAYALLIAESKKAI